VVTAILERRVKTTVQTNSVTLPLILLKAQKKRHSQKLNELFKVIDTEFTVATKLVGRLQPAS
jgi:hypothetical protein